MSDDKRPCQRCGGTGQEWLKIGEYGYYARCRDCYGSGIDECAEADSDWDSEEPPSWWPSAK